jgi:hypothetical protein
VPLQTVTDTISPTPVLMLTEHEKQAQGLHTYFIVDHCTRQGLPQIMEATIEFLSSTALITHQVQLGFGSTFYRQGDDVWFASRILPDGKVHTMTLTFYADGFDDAWDIINADGQPILDCKTEWHRQN